MGPGGRPPGAAHCACAGNSSVFPPPPSDHAAHDGGNRFRRRWDCGSGCHKGISRPTFLEEVSFRRCRIEPHPIPYANYESRIPASPPVTINRMTATTGIPINTTSIHVRQPSRFGRSPDRLFDTLRFPPEDDIGDQSRNPKYEVENEGNDGRAGEASACSRSLSLCFVVVFLHDGTPFLATIPVRNSPNKPPAERTAGGATCSNVGSSIYRFLDGLLLERDRNFSGSMPVILRGAGCIFRKNSSTK